MRGAIHLEDLDVDDDFGARLVVLLDDLLEDPTTEVVPRTVIVLAVLLPAIAGCTAMPGSRMIVLRICCTSVESACDR